MKAASFISHQSKTPVIFKNIVISHFLKLAIGWSNIMAFVLKRRYPLKKDHAKFLNLILSKIIVSNIIIRHHNPIFFIIKLMGVEISNAYDDLWFELKMTNFMLSLTKNRTERMMSCDSQISYTVVPTL